MYKEITKDKSSLIEFFSSVVLFYIAMRLTKINIANEFNVYIYFWAMSVFIVSIVQFISVKIDIVLWRLGMTWASGIVWTWFALTASSNSVLSGTLFIGALNIYAFILLSNRVHFNWTEFTKE